MERSRFAVAATAVALVAACTTGSPGPETVPTLTLAPRPSAALRERWEARGLDDYHLRYEARNLNGMGGSLDDGVYDAVVRDGTVVSCTITDSPGHDDGSSCVGSGQGSVETLFGWLDRFPPEFTTVELDPTWGFPRSISFDQPGYADEEFLVAVVEFEPLASAPGGGTSDDSG